MYRYALTVDGEWIETLGFLARLKKHQIDNVIRDKSKQHNMRISAGVNLVRINEQHDKYHEYIERMRNVHNK